MEENVLRFDMERHLMVVAVPFKDNSREVQQQPDGHSYVALGEPVMALWVNANPIHTAELLHQIADQIAAGATEQIG